MDIYIKLGRTCGHGLTVEEDPLRFGWRVTHGTAPTEAVLVISSVVLAEAMDGALPLTEWLARVHAYEAHTRAEKPENAKRPPTR